MIYFLIIASGFLLCAVWFSTMTPPNSTYTDAVVNGPKSDAYWHTLTRVFIALACLVFGFGAVMTESVTLLALFTIVLIWSVLVYNFF